MDEKVIKIAYPPITSYPAHAFHLAVLADKVCYLPWFYSNYIQIYFDPYHYSKLCWFDFNVIDSVEFLNPVLDIIQIQRSEVESYGGICKILIDALKEGYCVFIYVNEFFIPDSPAFNRKKFDHMILIYGYNLGRKTFMTAGFFKNSKFGFSESSFSQVEQAFYSMTTVQPWNQKLRLMKSRVESSILTLDIERVVKLICDYILSRNLDELTFGYSTPENRVYGFEAIKGLQWYIEQIINDEMCCDIKPLHCMYDHKVAMLGRIRYLGNRRLIRNYNYFLDWYQKIEGEALLARNLLIKYMITKDKRSLPDIITSIGRIQRMEARLLPQLCNDIKREL